MKSVGKRRKNGEIRQNYYYFAQLKEEKDLKSTEGILRWVPYDEVPALEMPGSAKHMILHYLKEGRFTDHPYGGITREAGTEFAIFQEF